MSNQYTVEAFLQHIKSSRAKPTWRMYNHGINMFSKWFNKTPNEILQMRVEDWASTDIFKKKRFARELENFHAWMLKEGYSINTARTNTTGIKQLFRFYEMPLTSLSHEISKIVPTVKDHVLTPVQIKKMFKAASNLRDKLIISLGKDLAWRIGDFAKIRRDQLPDLNQDAPILFELITEKQDILAKSYISGESCELLKEYLPTLPKDNPYLFPSSNGKYFDHVSINRMLKRLAAKANIFIPKNKRLRFHGFRKMFLSEASNLRIDINHAKLLCGKSVPVSMLTYLNGADLKSSFLAIHRRIRLTESTTTTATKDVSELEAKIAELEQIIHGIYVSGGGKYVEASRKLVASFMKAKWHANPEKNKQELQKLEEASGIEVLKMLGKIELDRQQAQYRKIIEENNNH